MKGHHDRFHTHSRSRRHPGFDYRNPGWYFVTINVRQRRPVFGAVDQGKMVLSEIGEVAHACWIDLPRHGAGVVVDAFVVMPDHVHGLICLSGPNHERVASSSRPMFRAALPGSLSVVVGGYKAAVSRRVRRAGYDFAWQPRFHDRIVRTERELENIRDYIRTNPERYRANRS